MITVFSLFVFAYLGIADGARVCCGDLGCFTDSPPFDDLPLPWCPDRMKPQFRLYTRANRAAYHRITHGNPGSRWKGDRRTIFILHGWQGDADMDWVLEMKNKFLDKGDFNVIAVDWRGGSQTGIDYWFGASNTRVMGAELNKLARETLIRNGGHASRFYCVGHSLGAHLCGFFGQRMNKIGRITGLDPAGPNFYDKPSNGRLSVASAALVDSIHTDGDSDGLHYGIGKVIGHVDFFPNGAKKQPGCPTAVANVTVVETPGVDTRGTIISCSHHRAIEFYLESLSGNCKFTSNACPGGKRDWEAGRCNTCSGGNCQHQGWYTDTRPGRGIFYLRTSSRKPFCLR